MDTGQVLLGAAVVVLAYLIGGIPFGVVVAKVTGGPDPRTIGSGRTGGANTMRALGPKLALIAGLLDAAKGAVVVLIAIAVGGGLLVQILAALAAILGHSRSIWIGFKGGRGIAPAFGGLVVIAPLVALIIVPIFVAVLVVSRYSSLASLTATAIGALLVIGMVALYQLSPLYAVYAIAAAGMIWLFHLDNIQRLLAGSERRIEWRS
ncbi:MAG TPA: glycerol-3-phosphate 1-O-acyltransferase PlsY [Candidatus Limnocylindrales bacterium]|nr:glycerol-3-phosphate 1-O-acyltransferase PlsY [Candidatus Limnocylindrales bacterium]